MFSMWHVRVVNKINGEVSRKKYQNKAEAEDCLDRLEMAYGPAFKSIFTVKVWKEHGKESFARDAPNGSNLTTE